MAAPSLATNDRQYVIAQSRNAKFYKIGWLVGLAVGALTVLYRCAG